MPITECYYGLTFGDVGPPTTTEMVGAAPCEMTFDVLGLVLSSSGSTDHHITSTPQQMSFAVGPLALSTTGVAVHVIASTACRFDFSPEKLSLSSSGVGDHIAAASPMWLDFAPEKLSLSSSGVGDHIAAASPMWLDFAPEKLALSTTGTDDHIVISSPAQYDFEPAKLGLATSGVGVHVVAATPQHITFSPRELSLSSSGTTNHVVSQSPSYLAYAAPGLSLSSSGVTSHVVTQSPSQCQWSARQLALSSTGVTEHIVTQTPSHLLLSASGLALASSGLTEHILATSACQLSFSPTSLSLSGVPGYNVAQSPCHLWFPPNPLSLSSTPSVGNAVCFQGAGYLNTGTLPGYNKVSTGYVAVWFRYDGGNPDIGTQFRNTVFMAQKDTEERIEFRIEEASPFAYPDLVIESDDGGQFGFSKLVTDLEGDGGPNIYDGNWHLLIWGRDTLNGWYFFVDGTEYQGRTGQNGDTWFSHIQNATDFDEIDIAANKVQAPTGNQRLYGCLDELLVVNNRLKSDVSGNDAFYLYNFGAGRLIPDIESANPDGLWDQIYNAWEFKQNGVVFGTEYKDPEADQRFDVTGTGYTIITAGIPG